MATAGLVAETLSAWREAERMVERLSPGTRDHETARLLAMELHALYIDLTEQRGESDERMELGKTTILHARELLGAFAATR